MKPSIVQLVKMFLLGCVFFALVTPLLLLLLNSFAHEWRWPQIIPASFSLRAWSVVFSDPHIWSSIGWTVLIGSMVVCLNLLLGLPAAKALAYYEFKGKSLVETFLLLPILIPSLAIGMGLLLTMIRVGLADHWAGVVLIHLLPTLPYTIRILRAGYENIGAGYEEAARNLGASSWKAFWTITVPLLFPSLRAVLALTFVISLSQYVLTALIGGGQVVTLAMIYYPYLAGIDRSVTAALSLLFVLLPILLVCIFELVSHLSRKVVTTNQMRDET
ncbi:ABC transporter permease [Alteribacillus iranensis]|uniref:Putative spermidine/putrescine transport system permease protein n=1 Tax=Alteribacillus iranensis TaxID=930128 RepID=A0A1I2E9Q5_9BACI|nr:ABC transporter permease subunit [Alteribacillus iranensis]SFE89218.1 putative spermidine/putrescine transport system permease protein [Alteribacillus iranensis]